MPVSSVVVQRRKKLASGTFSKFNLYQTLAYTKMDNVQMCENINIYLNKYKLWSASIYSMLVPSEVRWVAIMRQGFFSGGTLPMECPSL